MLEREYTTGDFAVVRSMLEEELANKDYIRRSRYAREKIVRETFLEIAEEEETHLGEFTMALIYEMRNRKAFRKGIEEFCEKVGEKDPFKNVCHAILGKQ